MKKYRDIENGRIYTEAELYNEFVSDEDLQERYPAEDCDGNSFGAYIRECTGKNGFLEEV